MAAGGEIPELWSHGAQGVAAGDPALPIIADGEWRGGRGLPPGVRGGVPPRPPREPNGETGPPAVPFEGDRHSLGQAAACEGVPPSAPVGSHGGPRVMTVCDMIEEAATAARILQEPELADILHVPDLSLFSPPVPVPSLKPEPEEVIEVPDSPPPVRPPPIEAPVDYRRAYEELQRRMQGHLEQMHFWAQTVSELGQELTREPTAQERARRQRLITAGYWPPWMAEVVGAPFSVLGENFRIYYGALLHEGGLDSNWVQPREGSSGFWMGPWASPTTRP